jgi:hypothetical protein
MHRQPSHLSIRWRPLHARLLAPLLVLAALLAGCASTVTTQVTPFHELTGSLEGQRFVIVPTPEQQSSLEFGTYADLVREALVARGLVDAGTNRDSADLGVSIAYEVIGRAPGMRSGTSGHVGIGAGSGGFSMGGIGFGIGFPVGGGSSSDANFQRTLQVRIDRLGMASAPAPAASPPALPGQAGPPSRVFEARAISEGPSASIAPVMAAMVRAIFDDFPGQSGKTRVVRVPMEDTR